MNPGPRTFWTALAAVLAFSAGCGGGTKPAVPGGLRSIPVTRSLSLPVEQPANPDAAGNKAALTLSAGGADELPEGPTGFDIMQDGGFLITDPLRGRLVSYDANGAFRWELPIQYSAETIRIRENGDLETVNAVDSRRYIHTRDARGNFGPPQPAPAGLIAATEADAGQAKLINAAHGTITDVPGAAGSGTPLEVFFEAQGRRMVSLRRLGRDAQGNSYVAIESGAASSTIDVQTVIRKFAPDGRAIAELQGLSSEPVVQPVEAFRQQGGVVYQMAPLANEVRIQIWDTNAAR
ncbi:MAG TPA: hypothetical protein VMA31_08045 [Bryobacteraceae bacterium]|nr:hypothetical protein [Bryobacteraceae bacterium]